ncbi:MAG TPA: ATP-binding protein [Kofleriaceae bacterium]|nr:ATP-binding protein [Kofleriaceae bacterium]
MRYRRAAAWLSIVVLALGAAVCVGWLFGIPALQQLHPSMGAMKLNTALSLVLLSVALRLSLRRSPPLALARTLAGLATAIAAASLLEYALGVDLGIDELMCADPAASGVPGRMSPVTGSCLTVLGLAILCLESRWAERLTLLGGAVAQVVIVGYLYGVRELYTIGSFASIALHTAFAIWLLALAVVMARPERGRMLLLASEGAAGVLARRLVPATLVLLPVLALLRQWGEAAGLYSAGFGRAMLVVANTVSFLWLILGTATALARAERERRAAEDAARDGEASLAITLDSIGDAVIATDVRGRVARMNPVAERLTGWPSAEARGRPLSDVFRIIDEDARQPVESPVDHVLREGIVVGLANHTVLIARDGSERAIADSGAPIRDPQGATRGVVLVFQDQSEARAAQRALEDSHDRLRMLGRVSHDLAMVATSFATLLETIAQVTAEIVGDGGMVTLISEDGDHLVNAANAHRDPARAADYRMLLSAMAAPPLADSSVSATVARTGLPQRAEVDPAAMIARAEPALRPLVERLNVHAYAVVPIRARNQVIGTLSLVRSRPGRAYTDDDVTLIQDLADRAGLAIENARLYDQLERRVRERTAELEAANDELEAFSSSVAHDLRAPLRAITGFSEILVEDHAAQLDAAAAKRLASIRGAAQRMGHLIDDLLDLSRIGRSELHRERVEISKLAHAVIERLRAADPDRRVEIVVEDGLTAQADPRLVDVVLTNLLGNAWKFSRTREPARIELTACASEQPTTYLVRDNGAGFEPARAAKLFGVFQRLHHADEFEGTGVGLATVQRVIHRHGGRVWAEGEVGKGATFFFTLEAGRQ